MAKKKWSSKAFEKAKEGALGSLDDKAHIMAAAKKNRGQTVRRLLLLANGSGDPGTRAKAKSLINAIEREMGAS